MTQQLAAAAPFGSTILLYSNLSEQDSQINSVKALIKQLRFEGWFLPNWLQTKNLFQALSLTRKAQGLLASNLATHIGKCVPLASAQEALDEYRQAMTNHKVLLQIGTDS